MKNLFLEVDKAQSCPYIIIAARSPKIYSPVFMFYNTFPPFLAKIPHGYTQYGKKKRFHQGHATAL